MFRIAAAQISVRSGDVEFNRQQHLDAIARAASLKVSILIFPELSLTGYEPELAASLAMSPAEERLNPLAAAAMATGMAIVAGAPVVRECTRPWLAALVFSPDGTRQVYAKQHLGGTEPDWFTPGDRSQMLPIHDEQIGLAICADSSRPSHPEGYARAGATVYATGVFLTAEWYRTDVPRLEAAAKTWGLLVVMANQGESRGTLQSVGQSTIWGPDGEVLARACGTQPCLVVATREPQAGTAECPGIAQWTAQYQSL